MARRFYSVEEVAQEVLMDDDSGEEDIDDDDDDFEPSSNSENEVDEADTEAASESNGAHTAFVSCMRNNNRNMRASSSRGRGRIPRGRVHRPLLQYVWTDDEEVDPPNVPDFTANPGVKADINPETPAVDYFNLFVDDNLMEKMVLETNTYAEQAIRAQGDQLKKDSLLAHWTPVTLTELKTFLGLLFSMGIVQLPDIRSYWSTHPILGIPFFRKHMSRNRFETIMTCFHLNNNDNNLPRDHADHDKLFKIRPLFDNLKDKFASVCVPGKNIAVDESMMPWRGRVAFRIFIPSKPIRYGMKLYMCCDSDTSFVTQMELYTGRKGDKREVDHGPNVVRRLTEPYKGQGYTVFVDSFFSSVPLFEQLRKDKITACGTIRKDRIGLPAELKQRKLKKGETVCMKTEIAVPSTSASSDAATLRAVRFNDKKDVTLLSTCYTGEHIDTGKVDKKTKQPILKPRLVHMYNQHINGVDNFDQNIQYYSFNRKTWKWWKRAAFHLLHLAKVQSFLVWKMKNPGGRKSQLQFTLDLIMKLTEDAAPSSTFKRPVADPPERLKEKHFLTHVKATEKKKYPNRICAVCCVRNDNGKGYKKKKETRYECVKCNKGLCIKDCFERFHTLKNFRFSRPAESDSDMD